MSFLALALLASCPQDFANHGGNAQRNGLTEAIGPRRAEVLWEIGRAHV